MLLLELGGDNLEVLISVCVLQVKWQLTTRLHDLHTHGIGLHPSLDHPVCLVLQGHCGASEVGNVRDVEGLLCP